MKKIKLLFIAFIFPSVIFAQGVEIVPFAGYMFGGSINYYEGKLKIENGMDYGLSLLVPIHDFLDLEVNYTRMDSKASFTPGYGYSAFEYAETNLATNYIHIGGISKFYKQETMATPFGSFSLGATWFSPSDGSFNDVWRFSINLGLGVKIMFSERVGVMLRGRLMMPMYFGSVGMYAGTGGSGVSVNSVVAPVQGDFNGGLIIKIGN